MKKNLYLRENRNKGKLLMTYTFTEDEIKIFLNWSVYVQGEKSHLEPEEEQMIRRLNKKVNQSE